MVSGNKITNFKNIIISKIYLTTIL
uniref:Uncharacterized protein n=1 Tax=Heterorhabditis bacteriophora TaxID=37862 RepID=A0A1I7X124_HETBA